MVIELLGTVSGEEALIKADTVRDVLNHPQELAHQATFTGRPTTQVFANNEFVLKIRSEFVYQPRDVKQRALNALQSDRQLGVYHPQKIWFLKHNNSRIQIGNITPRLYTGHIHLPQLLEEQPKEVLNFFVQYFSLYFSTAKNLDRRLDEGLSNFGWDKSLKIYYLDDDTYNWDDFTSFTNMLAVWIRQLSAWNPEFSRDLAGILFDSLLKAFSNVHAAQVLHGQLRNHIGVSEREQQCMQSIVDVIAQATSKKHLQRRNRLSALKSENSSDSYTDTTSDLEKGKALEKVNADRVGIIADVHANAPALEAVLAELAHKGITEMIVLGDVVGYGPYPQQCIEMLAATNCLLIQGNHDYAVLTGDTSRGFSKMARWGIEWTREHLQQKYIDWLLDLRPVHTQDNWIAIHGAPIDKRFFYAYVYHMTYQDNLDWMVDKKLHTAFHGHSHIQMSYLRQKTDDKFKTDVLNLNEYKACLVCPGSVGQPRGGSINPEFAIYDRQHNKVEFYQVEYDIGQVIAEMKRQNFPSALYERLQEGK